MTERASQTLRLPGGRRLGYAEYGAVDGEPIVYCHGLPSSRLEGKLFEQAAVDNQVRLIVPDRPGYGLSDERGFFQLAEWPEDIEPLMKHLDIQRFSVFGNSGGGPYALACAAKLSSRLKRVAITCALGPVDQSWAITEMNWSARYSFVLAKRAPLLLRMVYSDYTAQFLRKRPQRCQFLLAQGSPAADVEILSVPEVQDILACAWQEALIQGSRGALGDLMRSTRDWGFEIRAISKKVYLWHGDADRIVPMSHGRHYAKELCDVETRFIEGEGHFSLPIKYAHDILKTLSKSLSA